MGCGFQNRWPAVVPRCLPLSPVASRCSPLPPVGSRCLLCSAYCGPCFAYRGALFRLAWGLFRLSRGRVTLIPGLFRLSRGRVPLIVGLGGHMLLIMQQSKAFEAPRSPYKGTTLLHKCARALRLGWKVTDRSPPQKPVELENGKRGKSRS